MKFAQILSGVVQNTIILASYDSAFLVGYDYLIDITDISPIPAIGWLYSNDVFINSEPIIPNPLATMEDWDSYGLAQLQYIQVRNEIWYLLIAEVGSNFAGYGSLSNARKIIAAKWGLVTYAMRTAVISNEEDRACFKILLEETAGVKKENLRGRRRIIEEMRQYVGLEYFRTEVVTKADIDDFYSTASDYLNDYEKSNNIKFKNWLTNATGTEFENDGYAQKSYYFEDIVTKCVIFMNGIY